MSQLSSILWLSVFFQIVAVILALRLIPVSKKALAWITLSIAFLLMTMRRSISLLHQEGYIQSDWWHHFSTEIVALIISLLIVIGVFLIRDIFLQSNKNEARLSQVMTITGEGLWDWDIKRGLVTHNTRWCSLFGLDDEQLEHAIEDFSKLLHKDDQSMVMAKINNCLQNEGAYQSEHRMLRADGSVIWVEDRGDVVERDSNGQPLRMLGSVTDITQRKLAEQELRAQAKIIDQIHDSVISTDLSGLITSWNKGAERLFGYQSDEVLGKHIAIVYPQEEHDFLQNKVIATLQEQSAYETEVRMHDKSGKTFYAHLSLSMQYDDNGEITGMIGYAMDITVRKQAEEEIERLVSIVKHSSDFIGISDVEGHAIFLNDAGKKLVGIRDDEHFISTNVPDYFHEDDQQIVINEIIPKVLNDGHWVGEINFCNFTSGEKIPVWFDIFRIDHPTTGKPINFATVTRDIRKQKTAEQALIASEEKFRLINSRLPGIVYQFKVDVDGNRSLPYVSPAVETYIGLSAETVMDDADKWFALTHPDDLPGLESSIVESMQNMTQWDWEGRFVKNGNDIRWFRGSSTPERLKDGSTLWDGVFIDVTERKESILALEQSEERYRALAKVSPVGIFRTDGHGNCIYVNERWSELAGISEVEVLSEGWVKALHPEDRQRVFTEWNHTVVDHVPFKTECRFQRYDGKVTWLLALAEAELDTKGEVIGYVGAITDISERKQIEVALKESESLLEKAQQLTQIGHWKLNPATGEIQGSDELFRIFGLSREEATLDSFVEVVHPEDREMDVAAIQRSIEFGESWNIEHRLICCDGKEKWVHAIGEAITDETAKVVELLGTIQDITQQRMVENEIEQSRANFEAMFESIPDAIVYADSDRNIRMINRSTVEMFGYNESELTGNQTRMLYASTEDFVHQGQKRFSPDSKTNSTPYEITYKRKDGTQFQGETLSTPVKSSAGEVLGYLGIIRDVSERTHVEAILRSLAAGSSGLEFESFMDEVLERLTELYGCQYALVAKLQPDGEHVQTLAVRANGKSADNFEYALNGTPCQDILNLKKEIIPKNVSKIYPEAQILVNMGVESYFGAPLTALDGSIIGVLSVMSTREMEIDEWTEPVLSVFATRLSLELERDIATQELRKIKEHLEDLVEQRTYDLIVARDEAERANKAKSEFLSHMSHELRTPMNAILGFGQMLELDAEGFSETQREDVKEILDAGHHLLNLINEVLNLAKIESGTLEIFMEDVCVDDVLKQCIALISSQLENRELKIIDLVSGKGYTVHADYTRLKQVLLNLISNAVKYNREHGSITLDCEVIDMKRLRISVTDTGEGLTEENISKLFIPFQRLNAESNVEGTGIGLVITKHLIELMDGTIAVESIPEEGSTFCVELELTRPLSSDA
jgi:PAS domain S-box-containing protein